VTQIGRQIRASDKFARQDTRSANATIAAGTAHTVTMAQLPAMVPLGMFMMNSKL
jgi:hypothetical protein